MNLTFLTMCREQIHDVCCVEVGRRLDVFSTNNFAKIEIVAKMKIPAGERLKKPLQSELKRE